MNTQDYQQSDRAVAAKFGQLGGEKRWESKTQLEKDAHGLYLTYSRVLADRGRLEADKWLDEALKKPGAAEKNYTIEQIRLVWSKTFSK